MISVNGVKKVGISRIQVRTDSGRGTLPHTVQHYAFDGGQTFTFKKSREMRRHPTIGLARELVVAPIVASSWSYKGSDPLKVAFIKEQMEPIRAFFLYTVMYGQIDFGWKAFELIWDFVQTEKYGMRMVLKQLKALLNDITWAAYERTNGDYIGLYVQDLESGGEHWIPSSHTVFANFDEEGVGNYGDPRLQRCEKPYDSWNEIDDAASRYDEKMAGAHWIIQYPIGQTEYSADGGATYQSKDNSQIADEMLAGLKSSGSFSIPRKVESMLDEMKENDPLWKIELISSQGGSTEFTERQRYHDSLMIRGVGLLERSVSEGQYGTKAEAEEHGNISLMALQLRHEWATQVANIEIVERLCKANWKEPGAVEIVADPLTDERLAIFTKIYENIMSNPETAAEEMDKIDLQQVRDLLKVPTAAVSSVGGVRVIDSRDNG